MFWLQDRSNTEVSCAGLFVGSHIGFDFPGVWIHVDIAYPVFSVSGVIYVDFSQLIICLLKLVVWHLSVVNKIDAFVQQCICRY